MPDQNNKGGNHEFCGQCTVCKIILSHQNKQLNNCTCGNPPRGAHWESCASLCTKSNYEEKCYSCGGKGTYSQMHGVHGAEDFGGDGFDEKPSIHNYPCKACNGTGLKPKSNYEGKEKCKNCDRENHGDFACREYVKKCCISDSLTPQENDWKEKFYTEFKSLLYEYPNTYEQILSFIESLLALCEQEAYERGLSKLGIEMGKKILAVDDARASRDKEWKRAIEEIKKIYETLNIGEDRTGIANAKLSVLSNLLAKMSLSPEEKK